MANYTKGIVPRSMEINPLHGNSTMSKVDFYQLGTIVRQLKESGCTLQQIQTEINTKYLTEESQFLSLMSLSRWIGKNMSNAKELDQRTSIATNDVGISEYHELMEMIEYCNSQLELAEMSMNDIKKISRETRLPVNSKDVTNLINTTEKMIARKQALLASITQIKDKIYSWKAMNDIITIVTEKVKAKDLSLYGEIIHEIKSDPMLIEAYKKLKDIQG